MVNAWAMIRWLRASAFWVFGTGAGADRLQNELGSRL